MRSPSSSQTAKPLSTYRAPAHRSPAARADLVFDTCLALATAFALHQAFRKLAASRMELGVCPGGGVNRRFSTWPSRNTKNHQSAISRQGHKFDVLYRRFMLRGQNQRRTVRHTRQGGSNTIQQSPTSVSFRTKSRQSFRGPYRSGSPTSSRPSTNMRNPIWVGTRPALICGLPASQDIPDPA